jgi:hypothetical protein
MENREEIKNRMMKTAARLWGYSEDETESSFDPLVNLLFAACSLELEKISNDIHASRARLLEKMVQLVSPDTLTGALPAHAILFAKSVEKSSRLLTTDQFYATQKIDTTYDNGLNNFKDVFFAPAGTYQVNAAAVTYLATGYQLFRYREMISKEVIAQTVDGKNVAPAVLWLGMANYNGILNNTQFYFDIKNEVNKELFYDNLPLAKWFEGDHEMAVQSGYTEAAISGEEINIEQLLTQKNSVPVKVKELTNAFYKPKFVTVHQQQQFTVNEKPFTPVELLQAFDIKTMQQMQQENIRWIKIQFPENVPGTILQDVVCHANCFPVINCRLHEMVHRLHDIINIISFTTEDNFFSVHQVTDQEGEEYHNRSLRKNETQKISVMLRQGGVGRFDERDAATIIENIIQLLNDEGAAFAVLGREFVAGELKQLQQTIYKLEQQLLSKHLHRDSTPFLIVRRHDKQPVSNLFIKFWSTAGSEANDIKAGTKLQAYKTDGAYHNSCTLITATVGGRDKLSASENVTAYKSALLSRDRIISMEDIKIFCQLQMGNKAKQVEVKKGVMTSLQTTNGFARTIDVIIKLARKDYMDAQEKNQLAFLSNNLSLQLAKKSASMVPFRIFIEQAA